MRVAAVLGLVSVSLLLAACGDGSGPATGRSQAAAQQQPAALAPVTGPAIRGQLSVAGLNQLPPGLHLNMKLLDVTDPEAVPAVVSERNEPAPKILPHDYAVGYNPTWINPERIYVLEVTLNAETLALYATNEPVPVLTRGGKDTVDLQLVRGAVPRAGIPPAELLRREFQRIEGGLGGMRRVAGDRSVGDVMVGWDAFIDGDGSLRMAREIFDYGEGKGGATFQYAYDEGGKPFVIVREADGVKTWLGWDRAGAVRLNVINGSGELSDAEIAQFRKQAEDMYALGKRGR
jgi:uncharacterized lipoprotein YbaY